MHKDKKRSDEYVVHRSAEHTVYKRAMQEPALPQQLHQQKNTLSIPFKRKGYIVVKKQRKLSEYFSKKEVAIKEPTFPASLQNCDTLFNCSDFVKAFSLLGEAFDRCLENLMHHRESCHHCKHHCEEDIVSKNDMDNCHREKSKKFKRGSKRR